MLLRLQNSLASMTRLGREQERVANNLANANTVGYKKDRTFVESLNQRIDAERAPQSEKLLEQWADFGAGPIEATGNPLDVALEGDGFFVVTANDGSARFTRAGRFMAGSDGMLRDPSGRPVMGQNGPITLPPTGAAVTISPNGDIHAGPQFVDRLRVVTFDDLSQLVRADGASFTSAAAPRDVPSRGVLQAHLETSNVDVISEMTEMIQHFRLYESHQKVLQTTDQVLAGVTRDLGRF